jgi:hypothetical protein
MAAFVDVTSLLGDILTSTPTSVCAQRVLELSLLLSHRILFLV